MPIEQLEKGIVLGDAITQIQSAISFQPSSFFLAFIKFIDRRVNFGNYTWFQGILDYEISVGIDQTPVVRGLRRSNRSSHFEPTFLPPVHEFFKSC